MIHLTMNTGHRRISKRDEVHDDVIEAMQVLLLPGNHDLEDFGQPGYVLRSAKSNRGLFVLNNGTTAITAIGVAVHDDTMWRVISDFYERAFNHHAPLKPKSLPWVAAAILCPDTAMTWLGDFERCLAWSWIERGGR